MNGYACGSAGRTSARWLVFSLLVSLVSVAPARADTGLARHKKLYAVPRTKDVKVDGKFDDWDISAQIQMYVIQETSEMQSAKFAIMYDDQALYLGATLRDPTPMMNRHDPLVDADKGWDADACQFRLVTDPAVGYPFNQAAFRQDNDPEQPIHATLWYYTDRKEPVLQMFKSMSYRVTNEAWPQGVAPRDKFQAVYLKADDDSGYSFEYRIPWTTLGMKTAPKAGDLVAGTVQFCWSAPDGLKTAGGSAWAYDVMAGPGFPYQSTACWGKIIFSEKGNLPKYLVEEGVPPERPLPLRFSYDLPEDGETTVQLFNDTGLVVRTLVAQGPRRAGRNRELWDGLDDVGKPIPAGKYAWKGLYHQPVKTRFILSAHNSGQPPYKLDDNTGGWGGDHGQATTACAAGDRMMLAWSISESGWGIICTDLAGKKLWGIKHNATDMATDGERVFVAGDFGFNDADSVKIFDLKDGRPLNWGNGKPALDPPAGGEAKDNVATGVAYGNGTVYVSWGARNAIGVYDAKTGTLRETWQVPAPGRLAPRTGGSLAVISEGKVVVVSNGNAAPLIGERIDDPSAVAVGADGAIYVANRGKLQNVSVFSADGKYLRSIGKAGGRPRVGRYDNSGILEPGGMTIDRNGSLWIAETLDAPKRHSVWNTTTGELVNEFFGASSYFGWAYMNPRHPDELYCHNVLWKVDLDKGTCVPWSTIWRATAPNMIRAANPGGYAGHFRVMTANNGKQFGWGMVDYCNTLYMREGDIFKPIAGTIRLARGSAYSPGVLYPVMTDPARYPNGAYLWQDANNDQTVQENELIKSPAPRGEVTFNWIDPDLNAWCDDGYIFKPVRFEPNGRPIYDFASKHPIPFTGRNPNGTSLWLDTQDDTVYTLDPGANPGFARWTPDRKLIWGYQGIVPWPNALSLPVVTAGKLWGLTMPLGIAGDFTGAATYFGPYHIFTRDGLYVAMIMRDGRTGGLGPDITASETITGQLVKPDGMNRYFLLAGDQDGRVTEILGLDTVRRLPGGIHNHTEADVKAATDALAQYETMRAKGRRLDIVRGLPALELAASVGKTTDAARSFAARAAYDQDNFYVSFDVTSPCDLVNEITDPHRIFKGGNLLDIQIATDPAADPERKKPAPGDLRILVTRHEGEPVAVVFKPKVKGFAGRPIVLTSPTGRESFDSIRISNAIGLSYAKTPNGFKAVATVPLEVLGWTPKPGSEVRMDLGYIFGNATGSQAAARAYWTNNGFSANVTNDVPNESRLEPAEWGRASVE